MSSSNEDQKPMDNMELLKQQASDCAPGCGCHGTGPLGRKRLIVGTIVLLVAVALVARAVIKTNTAPSQPDAAAFASPIVAQTPPAESVPATPPVAAKTADTFVAKEIGAFAELNTLAAASDAVFVYVPGKDGTASNPPATAMKSAVSRIGSQGYKITLFTLKAGTRDYEQIAAQMPVPGVLAMVKGKGMSAVSGEVTETKLIQGFVAAGNCGPAGCGPAGCGPAGCGPVR